MLINHRSFGKNTKNSLEIIWQIQRTDIEGIIKTIKKTYVKCIDSQHKLSAVAGNKL